MEEKLIDRIGDEYLNPNFQDGQILLNSDVNEIVSIVKEGINANFNDIQKIQNGSHQVGNAKQLDGADLSKFSDGEMVGSDKLIPTSQQVKSYVDSKVQEIKDTTEVGKLVEDLNALGIEVGNKVDKTDLVNEETTGEDKAYNCDYINELFENGVGDSLPIGTIVEYTGENIPDGFEEVIEPEDATVYVGPTEPTGGQDVWIQKGKNLLNAPYTLDNKLTYSATRDDDYLTTDFSCYVEAGKTYTVSFESDGEGGGISGTDTVQIWLLKDKAYTYKYSFSSKVMTFTPEVSGCHYLRIDVNKNGTTHSFWNIQVEQGSTATEYEPYMPKKIFVKNDNGVYEEFYNEEEHNKEIYSTEEQRIGTWIDGKPLYRKVLSFPNGDSNALTGAVYTLSEYGIINVSNIFITHPSYYSYGKTIRYPFSYNDGNAFECNVDGARLIVKLSNETIANSPFLITLEYTKTTD